MLKPKFSKPIHTLSIIAIVIVFCACDSKADEPSPTPVPPPSAYTPPTDLDDYRSVERWSQRSQWGPYNVHDPSIEKDGEYYYVFSTDASIGDEHQKGTGHYMTRRSKDLVNWEFLGFALPSTPSWVMDTINNVRGREGRTLIPNDYVSTNNLKHAYWAPCIRKVGSKFRMYYVLFIGGIPIEYPTATKYPSGGWNCWGEREFIGWAEATTLAGPWTDKGMVVASVPDGQVSTYRAEGSWESYYAFNALDPSFIIDPKTGKHWLFMGSWNSGIAAIELDPDTGKTIGAPYKYASYKSVAQRGTSRWQGFEAPEIVYNPTTDYYYLFLAYDELAFAYNTRVCRSRTIEGPYFGSDNGNVTAGAEAYPIVTHPYRFAGHNGWQGISHNAIYHDKDTDKWFYNSQGHPSSATDEIVPYCMVQHIHQVVWTKGESDPDNDGWPLVHPERYAAVPQTTITEASVVGNWDVILLKHDYGKHNVSKKYVFSSDKNVTTSQNIVGTWAFDATNKVITLSWTTGLTDRLYLQDALNWETAPRVPTITFTGLTGLETATVGKKTNQLWGKKVR